VVSLLFVLYHNRKVGPEYMSTVVHLYSEMEIDDSHMQKLSY